MEQQKVVSAREAVPYGVRVAAWWSVCLLAIAVGVLAFFWGVTRLGVVTVSFVTGVMFAALLAPIVSWLVRRGVGRTTSAVIAFFVGVGSAAGLIAFGVAQIDDSSGEFARQLTLAEQGARHWLVDGPLKIDETSASRYTTDLGTTLSNHTADIVGWAAAHVGIVTGGLSALLLTLFCALFLLADDGSIWRWIVRLLPRGAHNHVDLAGAAAWRTLVVYMRSLVLLALLNAAAMLPVLWFADVPLAVPLTVVIFLGSLIPLVGVLLAAALMFAVAFVGNGLVTALVLVAILTVLVQLLGNLVNPLILGRFVDLHPVVILIGVSAGTLLGGAFGAFTAVPLIAVVNNMVKVMRSYHLEEHGDEDLDAVDERQLERRAKEAM